MMRHLSLVIAVAMCLHGTISRGEDWPQFRGPRADGISLEQSINKQWATRPPAVLWKTELSDNGNAAPAVAAGRVFIVDHDGAQDVVRALDLKTGQPLWQHRYDDARQNKYGFTVSTPLVDQGRLYILSRLGNVICLDAATGAEVWQRDLMSKYKAKRPPWDYCMSPMLDGQKLIFCPGGEGTGVVALDKATGEVLWQGGGGGQTSYATPLTVPVGQKKQYIALTVQAVKGVDAETGSLLWELPWPTTNEKKGPSPLLVDGRIFIASTEGGDCGMIQLQGSQAKALWKTKELQTHFTTPIAYHGRLWASCDPSTLVTLDPATGKILWRQKGFEYASLIGVDDTVIVLDGKTGRLAMLDATADTYRELGTLTPLGGQSWTAPIIADGKLLVRNAKSMVCLDLK